jgi:hypothetical protein
MADSMHRPSAKTYKNHLTSKTTEIPCRVPSTKYEPNGNGAYLFLFIILTILILHPWRSAGAWWASPSTLTVASEEASAVTPASSAKT